MVDYQSFIGLVVAGFASGLGSGIANYLLLEHLVKKLKILNGEKKGDELLRRPDPHDGKKMVATPEGQESAA